MSNQKREGGGASYWQAGGQANAVLLTTECAPHAPRPTPPPQASAVARTKAGVLAVPNADHADYLYGYYIIKFLPVTVKGRRVDLVSDEWEKQARLRVKVASMAILACSRQGKA